MDTMDTMDNTASLLLAAAPMSAKLTLIAPEILLFVGSVVVAVLGLSRTPGVRRSVPFVTALFLGGSLAVTAFVYRSDAVGASGLLMPMLGGFAKALIAAIAILLVMVAGTSIDRRLEEAFDAGRAAFDPIRVMRGEFFAFFLLAVAGTMLIANASDLIWLFLALELASLPTYVMVAVSRGTRRAQEAAVKYFFLGALSAATFLYGFAMLYGATGTLELTAMRDILAAQSAAGGLPTLAIIGGVLAFLGIAFKLAAVPMHFYAPDVYEGAGAGTTAFLGFIPKVAGVLALMMLLTVFGWSGHTVREGDQVYALAGLPLPLSAVLWMVAVLTMTLGNIGALLQRNVKRMLAYSSIAQSGYLLVGIIAGPEAGFDAALFYLVGYGVMNTAIFAVLASLERNGEEVETLEDLSGLRTRHPVLAWMLAVSAISLIGMPPLIGFFGKLAIFSAAFEAGQTQLVIIAAVNSAIGAFYYLQLVAVPMLGQPNARTESVQLVPSAWPRLAAVVCGVGALVMPIALQQLVSAAASSTTDAGGKSAAAASGPAPDADADSARLAAAAPTVTEVVERTPASP
jgi:NADH-quinone oxidoreductase subunit N